MQRLRNLPTSGFYCLNLLQFEVIPFLVSRVKVRMSWSFIQNSSISPHGVLLNHHRYILSFFKTISRHLSTLLYLGTLLAWRHRQIPVILVLQVVTFMAPLEGRPHPSGGADCDYHLFDRTRWPSIRGTPPLPHSKGVANGFNNHIVYWFIDRRSILLSGY